MRLDEIVWEHPHGQFEYGRRALIRLSDSPKLTVDVLHFVEDGYYDIYLDKGTSPLRWWEHLDALEAQCVLLQLIKEYHYEHGNQTP